MIFLSSGVHHYSAWRHTRVIYKRFRYLSLIILLLCQNCSCKWSAGSPIALQNPGSNVNILKIVLIFNTLAL